MCTGGLAAAGICDHKITKAEFPADIFSKFVGEGFGTLHEKAGPYAFRNGTHTLLGALHEDGHLGDFLTDEAAEVYAGIQLLICGFVISVKDKADVRDYTKKVFLVFLIQGHCVVVVGGHEDLWPCALAEDLLVFVDGIKDGV